MSRVEKRHIKVDFSNLPKITNTAYVPLYKNKSRYLVLYGGAGSGKSVFVGQKIVFRMLTETGHKFLVARKVEATIRESARAEIIGAMQQMGVDSLFKYSKAETGEMSITCIANGNKIIFRGLDNKEKLKSIKDVTGVWLEEASDFTLDDFTQLDLRLRGKHIKNYKQMILSFNPISSKHWLKRRFFDEKDENATISHTTYLDNEFVDDVYIDILEKLKKTNKRYYDIYALGKWGVLKGLIYEKYTVIDEMPNANNVEVHRWGQDFGFNNPSATVEIMIEGNNLYLNELLYETQLTNTALITRLKTKYEFLMKIKGYLDSAEPDRIKEFKDAGFDVLPALKNVNAGIDRVQSYKIFVTRNSENIINELDVYSWKLDRNNEPLDEPIKENDHSCDAFRYGVFTDNQKPSIVEVIKKPAIVR